MPYLQYRRRNCHGKMCLFPSKHHGISHCKCVLRCCDTLSGIVIPTQEENIYTTNTCPTIRLHVYQNISHRTFDSRRQYEERTTCTMCSTVPSSDTDAKVYTRKDLVLLVTPIIEFHKKFYIPEIQNWLFICHLCGS